MNGRGEAFHFRGAGDPLRHGPIAAGGFHDEHIGGHILKAGGAQNRLIVKADVAGGEHRFLLAAQHDARRAQRVAGVVELQGWGTKPGAGLRVRRPLDFAIVAEALEQRRDVVHLVVRIKRVFLDAELVALAGLHVHGIVQHPLNDEIALLRHQDVGFRKMPDRDRQGANVVVVTMGDGNGVHLLLADGFVERQPIAALAFGVHPGVKQDAMAFDFNEPGARANVRVGIQVCDSHLKCGARVSNPERVTR